MTRKHDILRLRRMTTKLDPHVGDTDNDLLISILGVSRAQLQTWPGAWLYRKHVEQSFAPLLTDAYAVIWEPLGLKRPREKAECWSLLRSVVRTADTMPEGGSIEAIWRSLTNGAPKTAQKALITTQTLTTAASHAIFSMLCLRTMLFQPCLLAPDGQALPPRLTVRYGEQQSLRSTVDGSRRSIEDMQRRPLQAVFQHFRREMATTRWRHHVGEENVLSPTSSPPTLHVSSINYKSLHTIGKIELIWVDSLSEHLELDAANRRLHIFKLPSFCALSTLTGVKSPSALSSIHTTLFPLDNKEQTGQHFREILMTYRLIFGQGRSSRRLAHEELNALHDQTGEIDPLLRILCERPATSSAVRNLPSTIWPATCWLHGKLQEEGTYSPQDDFPLFGQRLVKLQEFSSRQAPSRLRDLWRDRRNPLQWYTFWAVLIVGSASLLITLLQLLVGIAQLVIAIKLQPGGSVVDASMS